jgi:hypothetical protein
MVLDIIVKKLVVLLVSHSGKHGAAVCLDVYRPVSSLYRGRDDINLGSLEFIEASNRFLKKDGNCVDQILVGRCACQVAGVVPGYPGRGVLVMLQGVSSYTAAVEESY